MSESTLFRVVGLGLLAALGFVMIRSFNQPEPVITQNFEVPAGEAFVGSCLGGGSLGGLFYDIEADAPVTFVAYDMVGGLRFSEAALACDSGATSDYGPCDMDALLARAPGAALDGGYAEDIASGRITVSTRSARSDPVLGRGACFVFISRSDEPISVTLTILQR